MSREEEPPWPEPDKGRAELSVVKDQESVAPKTAIKKDQPAQAKDGLNWSQTAHELDLEALPGQVVINCVVQSWQDNHLQLAYLPELELMIKPGVKDQIKQAIESKLGLELKLDFISVPRLDAETPQQAYVRLQQEEHQAAIVAIRQDPVVQKLNSLFGARLIENSVKKVKQ